MTRQRTALGALFVLGALVRMIDLWHPVDGVLQAPWRECDGAAIARNFYREGMNPLLPRIDWRGDGPGFTEMELPILPWCTALGYKLFGFHEEIGRILAYGFSLATLFAFLKLATRLLPTVAACVAVAFFALSPVVVRIATTLQPEGLMLAFYVTAVYWFLKWLDDDSRKSFAVAVIATALAVLAKAPAAHIGLLFAGLLVARRGLAVFSQAPTWIFAFGSLFPAALWYSHAKNLWRVYGNSLGASNQVHLIGWDVFTDPGYVVGLARSEILHVWVGVGLVVAAFAVTQKLSDRAVRFSIAWLGVVLIYYLVILRTSSARWASYYHVVSVPPAALLIGVGAESLVSRLRSAVAIRRLTLASIAWLLVVMIPVEGDTVFGIPVREGVMVVTIAAIVGLGAVALLKPKARRLSLGPVLFSVGLLALPGVFLLEARLIAWQARPQQWQAAYQCAQELAPTVLEGDLIVASGGTCTFGPGLAAAYNASYMFYWMDRKGFNICRQEQSMEALQAFVDRGARYFVAEKPEVRSVRGFEQALIERYEIVRECPGVYLFDLTGQTVAR